MTDAAESLELDAVWDVVSPVDDGIEILTSEAAVSTSRSTVRVIVA